MFQDKLGVGSGAVDEGTLILQVCGDYFDEVTAVCSRCVGKITVGVAIQIYSVCVPCECGYGFKCVLCNGVTVRITKWGVVGGGSYSACCVWFLSGGDGLGACCSEVYLCGSALTVFGGVMVVVPSWIGAGPACWGYLPSSPRDSG